MEESSRGRGSAACGAVEDRVVAHSRQAVDDPDLLVDVELRPSASRSGGRGLR